MSKKFILDEDFEYFLEKFGSPVYREKCTDEIINRYKGKLPNRLLDYWSEYGFCSFKNGLFWIVNPDEYNDTLSDFLSSTNVLDQDFYHVIARNAFGDLFLWGEKTGYKYEVVCANGWVIEKNGNSQDENDFSIKLFFGINSVNKQDVRDVNNEFLFDRCVKRFGGVDKNEVFAFEPSLIIGGEPKIENINKVDIHVYLSILAQLGEIEVLDNDALIRKAF